MSGKKIASKVCLQYKPGSPTVPVTFVEESRSKRMRQKTSYSLYKNTSDPTNARVDSQHILIKDCDAFQCVAHSWELKTYGTRYLVGKFDPQTKEMELLPSTMLHTKPYLRGYEEDSDITNPEKSYGQKHKDVMLKFGDTRIRRSITGKDRIQNMEGDTLEEAMTEAISATDQANLTSSSEQHHSDILPPINVDAVDVNDVFLITDFITEAELLALQPFTQALADCSTVHVQTWREQKKFPEFVLSRLPVLMDDQDVAHLHLSKLLYISYLITLYKLPQKQLRNKLTNFPNTPPQVVSGIYKTFTSQGKVDGHVRTSMSDKQRNKLLTYLLCLTLMVDNFSVDFMVLCQDLGVSQRIISDTYRSLGCKIMKIRKVGEKTATTHAALKIPVKLPEIVLRKGGKKRD